MEIARGLLGLASLIFICFLFSNNRRAIDWKLVGAGLVLQLLFAIGILHVPFFRDIFQYISQGFVTLINLSHKGTEFLFGNLADQSQSWAYVFAVQVLPNIVFFAALSALLYYLGILQIIVYGFAWVMSKTMKQISGAESMSTAANIFLGQTEAPLMVKPYLAGMTKSEILCVMIGGMANTAGSVLAAYVSFLGGADRTQQEFYALHMLSQSIMSAPAAIVCAKILFPQTELGMVARDLKVPKEKIGSNVLDAIANGTTDGLKLALNVAGMLVVFIALMAVLNYLMHLLGGIGGLNDQIISFTGNRYDGLSLQFIFGYLFAPLAWLMGVSSHDMLSIGQLLGEKTVINEFVAYISMGNLMKEGLLTDPRSIVIATYALCGFANFSSIGIQIGGIGALAPNQRQNLSSLGIKSLIGGTIACFMTAVIAGMLYSG
ncbi:MAG TPA: nucleoside transporter C-terminal domain-containing protein [Chitinophagales bacterium]|nr:nucleoside transporter C-terminal domain-containing protein [Chitinophagales bacterium]